MKICPIKCFFCGLLFFCASALKAQLVPLPDEDDLELSKERVLCQPGVKNKSVGRGLLLQWRTVGSQFFSPSIGEVDGANSSMVSYVERVNGKVKIPILNKASLKVLLGYEYAGETFHFDRIGYFNQAVFESLDGNTLHTNKYSLYVTKSFDEDYYVGLRLRTSYRGDHEEMISFDPRYVTYSGLAAFGYKPNEDLEYGVGLTFGRNFFRTQILPFGIYNQTFNEKWGIETVLPVQIMMRYNFTPSNLLLFGLEYQSKSYSLDVYEQGGEGAFTPYYFRHAEIAFKATYDVNLFSWIWFNAEGGYQLPLNSRFDNTVDETLNFRARNSGQPFFSIGVFVTPPRDCRK